MRVSFFVAALVAFSGARLAFGAPAVVAAPVGRQFPATVELRLEKPTVLLGEPMFLKFVVKNPTNTSWRIFVGDDYNNRLGRPSSFDVEVRNERGVAVFQPDVRLSLGGSFMFGSQELPAHGELPLPLFLPDWATFSEAGRYRITVKRSSSFLLPGKNALDAIGADGKSTYVRVPGEASAELTVLPADAQKMGALISEWGEAMLANPNGDSDKKRLRAVHDARVVPFLIRAVARPEPFDADVDALGNYNDDAAFEALKTLATNMKFKGIDMSSVPGFIAGTTDSTRLSAARAIARHSHKGATAFLLSLRHDPSEAVRLVVVQNIGGLPIARARAVWRQMADDSASTVRDEAKRCLKKSRKSK